MSRSRSQPSRSGLRITTTPRTRRSGSPTASGTATASRAPKQLTSMAGVLESSNCSERPIALATSQMDPERLHRMLNGSTVFLSEPRVSLPPGVVESSATSMRKIATVHHLLCVTGSNKRNCLDLIDI